MRRLKQGGHRLRQRAARVDVAAKSLRRMEVELGRLLRRECLVLQQADHNGVHLGFSGPLGERWGTRRLNVMVFLGYDDRRRRWFESEFGTLSFFGEKPTWRPTPGPLLRSCYDRLMGYGFFDRQFTYRAFRQAAGMRLVRHGSTV